MQLIKQLQNTVNQQFLYDFIKEGRSEVVNPVGAKLSISKRSGLKSHPALEVKRLGRDVNHTTLSRSSDMNV
jgi:hypothetical protein